MWMADESEKAGSTGGTIEMAGTIISDVRRNEPKSGSFFSRNEPEAWMFRIEDDRSGRPISVRFDGPVSGMVDQGDRVRIRGYMIKGILNARRITDEHGAVLAQAKCFVATTCFESMWAPEVEVLRRFRDRVLTRSGLGRHVIATYWRVGPILAGKLGGTPRIRFLVRHVVLGPLCWILTTYFDAVIGPVPRPDSSAGARRSQPGIGSQVSERGDREGTGGIVRRERVGQAHPRRRGNG